MSEVLHCNDSKSLWNYTLSPGWTSEEVAVFRLALMKFGMGRWNQIVNSRCLPGKTVAQLNNQMQRMIGQQSTKEFMGLHIDPTLVFQHNEPRTGQRKNGCLINTGDNPTKEVVDMKKQANRERWALGKEEIEAIVIPTLSKANTSIVQVKTVGGNVQTERTKLETLSYLNEQLRLYQQELNKRTQQKKQGRTGRDRQKRSKQEQKDAELAAKLQMEFVEEDAAVPNIPGKRRRTTRRERAAAS